MSLISDILLVAASVGLAVYCVVLSRRLSRFTDLEKGVGGAVAVLSAQVDDLTRALKSAQATAQESADALSSTTERAEDAAGGWNCMWPPCMTFLRRRVRRNGLTKRRLRQKGKRNRVRARNRRRRTRKPEVTRGNRSSRIRNRE